MKILFWNVQRLGSSTPRSRSQIMEGVIAEAFSVDNVDLAFLCEVSGSTAMGGVGISK
jgi:hypothetical protein